MNDIPQNNAERPLPMNDERVSAYLDGELSGTELARFEILLREDPAYQSAIDELREASQSVKSLPKVVAGNGFSERVMQRVTESAAKSREANTGSDLLAQVASAPEKQEPFGRRPWVYAALILAAALLFMFLSPEQNIWNGGERSVALSTVDTTSAHDGRDSLKAVDAKQAIEVDEAVGFAENEMQAAQVAGADVGNFKANVKANIKANIEANIEASDDVGSLAEVTADSAPDAFSVAASQLERSPPLMAAPLGQSAVPNDQLADVARGTTGMTGTTDGEEVRSSRTRRASIPKGEAENEGLRLEVGEEQSLAEGVRWGLDSQGGSESDRHLEFLNTRLSKLRADNLGRRDLLRAVVEGMPEESNADLPPLDRVAVVTLPAASRLETLFEVAEANGIRLRMTNDLAGRALQQRTKRSAFPGAVVDTAEDEEGKSQGAPLMLDGLVEQYVLVEASPQVIQRLMTSLVPTAGKPFNSNALCWYSRGPNVPTGSFQDPISAVAEPNAKVVAEVLKRQQPDQVPPIRRRDVDVDRVEDELSSAGSSMDDDATTDSTVEAIRVLFYFPAG